MCSPPDKSLPDKSLPDKKPSWIRKFLTANSKWVVTICVEIAWFTWAFLDREEHFGRFTESTPFVGYYYFMSITMLFGSLVAGATSEGGGAVAFPVMTLALGVPTVLARDFSFAIQSFGMTAASFMIFFLRVPLDNEAVVCGSIGGTIGLLVGLEGVAPYMLPAYTKMFFVSLWLSFSMALFKLNTRKERRVYNTCKESDEINYASIAPDKNVSIETGESSEISKEETDNSVLKRVKRKRIMLLLSIGIFGGLCSSIAGSGLDMATFSMLTLYFRVSEKIATPTSVVLMAGNAVAGMIFRLMGIGGSYAPGEETVLWKFVSVCIPVVVIGAPIGAHIPTILSRHQISYIVYVLSTLQFLLACGIVKPWSKPAPHGVGLMVSSAITLIGGSIFFYKAADWGEHRDVDNESKNTKELDEENNVIVEKTIAVGDETVHDHSW